jgi:signal transduction histidine kinase/ActR/RegA family two-component response regulator
MSKATDRTRRQKLRRAPERQETHPQNAGIPEATDAAAREQTAPPAVGSERPRVLLADDNSDMRAYVRESEERLRRTNLELMQRVNEIEQANLEIENGRRAALNLMEDTVNSRRGVEALNVELRESEEALRRLNNELEQRVSERTQDLAQSEDRLRMLATELNLAEQRERKRLATELHDYLAQLLVLCHMSLAQAKRVGLPPRAEELVKQTEETLGKALNYCRTLMAELSPPVLQQEGLPAGLKWLADHMKRQDLAVTIEVDDVGKLFVPDDRAVLLFQSVRELLINVAKHATVKTATVRMSHENGLLQLVVRDENGFDLAAVSARDTTSPLSSRFGLFSIRERMKALGGSFVIESAPGLGTTATLTLQVATNTDGPPLRTDRRETAVAHRQSTLSLSPDDPPRSTQASGSKKDATIRLLLVDDQTLMRQGLRSIVSAYNHLEVVGEARDGMEAVEIVQRLNPDVVVMDINMPNLDGIEATKRIKAYRSDIAVIGLSVNPSIETEQKMKAAGAASYLTKESAAEVLCQAIDKAMAPKQGIATQQGR